MNKFTRWFASITFAAVAGSAQVLPIVTVDGKDWLQPLDFINLSWNDMNAKCDATTGACTGVLGTTEVTGYTWASVNDVAMLFNAFLPGVPLPGVQQQSFPKDSFIPLLLNAGFLPTVVQDPGTQFESSYIAGFTRTPCGSTAVPPNWGCEGSTGIYGGEALQGPFTRVDAVSPPR